MASDSRVSGSEDARKPDKNTDSAPEAKVNPQQPAGAPGKPAGKGAADRGAGRAEGPDGAATKRKDPAAGKPQATAAAKGDGGEDSGDQPRKEDESSQRESFLAGNRFLLLNAVPSWLVSMVLHAVMLIVLALLTLPERVPEPRIVAVSDQSAPEDVEDLKMDEIDPMDVEVFEGLSPSDTVDERTTTAELAVPSMDDVSAAPTQMVFEDMGDMSNLQEALIDRVGGGTGTGLGDVRGANARRGLVERNGGSAGSEKAVAAALKWLAEHQMRDGGWDFDHTKGTCRGRCTHAGTIPPARNGATAMALLPFLGAGQTHKEGQYKETVERGLTFLVRSMKLGNNMGDLSDAGGRMYSHGLASIALCEAYAMTNDPGLLQPAQLSLNFIVYAQDPVGGGWRYRPHQAGDTSVVGWQLMACKSGHLAYLKVPRKTILGATKFLDFVQMDNGAKYGYTVPAQGHATTAVGLLCRMYLGWKHDNPSLKAGAEYLAGVGPNDNMYYNYYATQVMMHYGGEFWEQWNTKMRDRLVESQDTKGHAAGSWYMTRSSHGDKGGRLYCTSMATMILEVYYRHMPIYGQQAAEEEFPL